MSPVVDPPVVDVDWELFAAHHDALRARVRAWVAERIAPHVEGWEAADPPAFPRELFTDAGAHGLFGWKVDASHGGNGADFLADCVVTEELAGSGSGGVAAALGAHKDLGAYYIWRFGTHAQREQWVRPSMTGQAVTALGVTEPHAGTDVAAIRTRAQRQPGGDWLLNGSKTFITNGSWADVVVVAAVTGEQGGHHGQTLFLVQRDDPGFSARRLSTLGWRTSHTGELSFVDVRLPADRVLGGEELLGQGFVCIMRNFQWERIAMSMAATHGARRSLEGARRVLRERFGEVPAAWRPRLADLHADIAAARALAEHAVRRYVHGEDALREVSMVKWLGAEVSVRAADEALQAHGAAGVTEAAAAQRALRDTRLGPIGGGTNEIMKEVVGRSYGL